MKTRELFVVGFLVPVLSFLFCSCGGFSDPPQEQPKELETISGTVYTRSASAVTDDSKVFFTDSEGNIWVWFLAYSDDPVVGNYTLILTDNNTPNDITDDIVLAWR